MNVGLFGGTFDPIHRGHTSLANAAREFFHLGKIHFVPANRPPHKQQHTPASFFDRYAMVSLATSSERAFTPSLLEAPDGKSGPNYSIDTIRRLKRSISKSDVLFFLIGIDAFKYIAQWHEAEALLAECEFIIASRPGYSLADVANCLPQKMRPAAAVTKPFAKSPAKGQLILPGAKLHLLDGVNEKVSATGVREAVRAKRSLGKLVHPAVAEYIQKLGLYKR